MDRILYHYTSIDGANGILNSCSAWMSDCRYLNDRDELLNSIKLFFDGLDSDLAKTLPQVLIFGGFSRFHCVLSLSESPQILSQWRAYADDGRGIAIGFQEKFLTTGWCEHVGTVVDCVYDDHYDFIKTLTVELSQEIAELCKMFSLCKGAINEFYHLISREPKCIDTIFAQLLRAKNPAFKEEREVRLVKSVTSEFIKTRVAHGVIVPYISNKLWRDEDRNSFWVLAPEIWLGPKCDERNSDSLKFFQQLGWVQGIKRYDCGYR